jgi:hypothetical protein
MKQKIYDEEKDGQCLVAMAVGCGGTVLAVIVVGLVCLLMCSCRSVETVVVTKHHTDTLMVTKHQRDSVWLHDSISVKEKGDTVTIEKWHTKYNVKEVHDTIYQAKHDTIPQPYPVIKEVEKKLSKPQKGLMGIGLLSLMGILIFIATKLKRFIP